MPQLFAAGSQSEASKKLSSGVLGLLVDPLYTNLKLDKVHRGGMYTQTK